MEEKGNTVWVEKYRPKSLEEIEGNDVVMSRLKAIASDGNLPNLLLAGPPGIGKTTTIFCLCRHLLGPSYRSYILQLNASDDRGIDVVREKIKVFAQKSANLPANRHKVIILDEADSMTEGAQQAMRRVMEEYCTTTRFALACNQSSKIIEPVQSRCAIVRFAKLSDEQITKRLVFICKAENLTYDSPGLCALVMSAEGDMRNAINNLQSTHMGFVSITKEHVLKVCSLPPPEKVQAILSHCLEGRLTESHDTAVDLLESGYSPLDIVGTIRSVLRRFKCVEHLLLEFIKATGVTHATMIEGLDTRVQLDKLLASLCKVSLYFGGPSTGG